VARACHGLVTDKRGNVLLGLADEVEVAKFWDQDAGIMPVNVDGRSVVRGQGEVAEAEGVLRLMGVMSHRVAFPLGGKGVDVNARESRNGERREYSGKPPRIQQKDGSPERREGRM
jgi:hypothetical protein